jgi:SAM-dependent methyltransferase
MPKMSPETAQKLIELNRVFYEDNAKSFSSTRYAIQPGVQLLMPKMLLAKSILDLGCGNGNLALALHNLGFTGNYLGVDNSLGLIDHALATLPTATENNAPYRFLALDLGQTPWQLPKNGQKFDLVVSYATLHHIPGLSLQMQFFNNIKELLEDSGKLIISCWQPLNSPRLAARVQDWSIVDIEPNELSEGDLLLDWRADDSPDKQRLRYVHQFSPEKLEQLGNQAGLRLQESFFSDGKEGRLGFYQIWQKPAEVC